jgi:gamma-glutamyltranspeptidase/glutathione hydrolase
VQCQAMLQVLLNRVVFGMDAQEAVEAPRFATYCAPDSFAPHAPASGRLLLESRFAPAAGDGLAALGHLVDRWPDWTWRAGGVCLIEADPCTGVMTAGADPRRPSYAVGW